MISSQKTVSERVLEMENELRPENYERPQYDYALRMLRALRPAQRRVVEFGVGRGEFSNLLRQEGYDVTCVDINKEKIRWLKTKGFEAFEADLNEPLAMFDA